MSIDPMTQDNGHTAGPWRVDVNGGEGWSVDYDGPSSQYMTVCGRRSAPVAFVVEPDAFRDGEIEANARLIAAAPDQFAIIKEFIAWVDRFTGSLREDQSEALFDLYRRARSTYRNVDPASHDASREAAILSARGEAG